MKIGVFAGRSGWRGDLPVPTGGTGLYRMYFPHELMVEWGHDIVFSDKVDYDVFKDRDIVIFSKSGFGHAMGLVDDLKEDGIKTIIDFDDFWTLPSSHFLYDAYRKQNTTQLLISALRKFDYVSCTTPLLRYEIRKINPNVEVLENALDPENKQFKIEKSNYSKCRIGWVGGQCHFADIALLDGSPQRLTGNFDMSLFGHDGQENSVYDKFGYLLSGRLQLVKQGKFNVYKGVSPREYTKFYNMIDVAIAPLVNDRFNSMKSELKMVEAGFMKKAMVVSDVWPYRYLINGKNCLTVTHKHHWSKQLQKLINSKSLREDLAEALYESVKDKYHLKNVTKRREQWYESMLF